MVSFSTRGFAPGRLRSDSPAGRTRRAAIRAPVPGLRCSRTFPFAVVVDGVLAARGSRVRGRFSVRDPGKDPTGDFLITGAADAEARFVRGRAVCRGPASAAEWLPTMSPQPFRNFQLPFASGESNGYQRRLIYAGRTASCPLQRAGHSSSMRVARVSKQEEDSK